MFAGEFVRCDLCSRPRDIVIADTDTIVPTGDTVYLRNRLSWYVTEPSMSNLVIFSVFNRDTRSERVGGVYQCLTP